MASRRFGKKVSFRRKLLLAGFGVATVAGLFDFGLVAKGQGRAPLQTPAWQTAAGDKMTFDVASVKQNNSGFPGDPLFANIPLDDGDDHSPNGGLFRTTHLALQVYISFAYKLRSNQLQILQSQAPKWVLTDRYDIQARSNGNPTKDQMRLMMQSLLADRFKLAIHYETRQLPVFALVLTKAGKTGPQLRSYPDDAPCSAAPPPTVIRNGPGLPSATVLGEFPTFCGSVLSMTPKGIGRRRVGARNVTMDPILDTLARFGSFDRPMLDQTKLSGVFDFAIEWTPGQSPSVHAQKDVSGPSLLEAMKDQLGLKLDSKTAPMDILVIDHIEQLSEN